MNTAVNPQMAEKEMIKVLQWPSPILDNFKLHIEHTKTAKHKETDINEPKPKIGI